MPRDLRDDLYLHARRELRTDKNTFRAITLLSDELQSSRSVPRDQRDEIQLYAQREPYVEENAFRAIYNSALI